MTSTCGTCRHPQHAQIDQEILRGDIRLRIARRYSLSPDQIDAHALKHLPSLWERCVDCAQQMMGGPRCLEHNPTPEMRAAMAGA